MSLRLVLALLLGWTVSTPTLAAVDTDNDGYPDWFFGGATQLSNGHTVDKFPNKPAAALDSDNDGFPDAILTQTFDLTTMDGLALWLDSMNINGNNNYGITDNDGISQWSDLSGNNHHAIQETLRQFRVRCNLRYLRGGDRHCHNQQ